LGQESAEVMSLTLRRVNVPARKKKDQRELTPSFPSLVSFSVFLVDFSHLRSVIALSLSFSSFSQRSEEDRERRLL